MRAERERERKKKKKRKREGEKREREQREREREAERERYIEREREREKDIAGVQPTTGQKNDSKRKTNSLLQNLLRRMPVRTFPVASTAQETQLQSEGQNESGVEPGLGVARS